VNYFLIEYECVYVFTRPFAGLRQWVTTHVREYQAVSLATRPLLVLCQNPGKLGGYSSRPPFCRAFRLRKTVDGMETSANEQRPANRIMIGPSQSEKLTLPGPG
jgi:hypothetical protein